MVRHRSEHAPLPALRLARLMAALSVLALVTWLARGMGRAGNDPLDGTGLASPASSMDTSSNGSVVPCQTPLAWRIARVDEEFGLDAAAAHAVVTEAAELWAPASTAPLFVNDAAEGFPIRFVYDERQARTGEQRRAEGELDAARDALDADVRGWDRRMERHRADVDRFESRARAFEDRVDVHENDVGRREREGSASPEVIRELEAVSEALITERRELEGMREVLEGESEQLRRQAEALDSVASGLRETAEELERRFPLSAVEAAEYREAVTRRGSGEPEVSREVRIYRFVDVDDLRIVVAHELGHALGLGHVDDPASLMWEGPGSGQFDERSSRTAAPSDLERLRALCAVQ